MSKTKDVRDALAKGPLTFRKLHETVGGDDIKLLALLRNLQYRGQLKIGTDDERTIKLTGKAPKERGTGKPRRRKATAPAIPTPGATSYKDVADRFTSNKPLPADQLRSIILENLIASGAGLRKAVHDQVEGADDNAELRSALDQSERAERLFQSSCPA